MIAKYNGKYYYYINNRRVSNIITNRKEKAVEGFLCEDNVFYKKVPFENCEDVFDVKYVISYDAGLIGISTDWEISNDASDIQKNGILIRFSNGVIPGWKVEENNVCINYINLEEATNIREIYIYKRKDSTSLERPIIEEKSIATADLISKMSRFDRSSL